MHLKLQANKTETSCTLSSSDTHAFYYTNAMYEWSANVMDTTWVSDNGTLLNEGQFLNICRWKMVWGNLSYIKKLLQY